ncbi:MAG TPA: PAS domain-containing protein [Candidatus Dormibacteraeota bacterium]|nr:PAS domain-containing protein [Candidatus Dormibacteraeota bacterium]
MTTKDDDDKLLRSVALQNANSILVARHRAEQRSEAYLAEAQRLSHTGSFGWRVSTGEIIWSEETFRIFQYDRTTKPTVELLLQRVHPEDAALVKQTIERASQDGRDFDHEYRLVMPDRSVKYVHVVAHGLSDESGSIEFVGAVMDVTAAKQTEGRIRQIIDTIPAYAWSTEPDGSVDFINKRFVEFTGRSVEELLGWGWGSTHHPDDIPRHVGVWRAALAAGEPMESEVRVRGRDGDYRWLLIRNVPLHDELGNIAKWYGTAIEIEDRKRADVLLAGEKRLLEMIARGDSRALILDGACRLVEELASGSLSSILLLDRNANCLRHGAAPSLPITYTKAIDGAVIGPSVGSCGTAAYRAEPVIVSDIATDPLWADYRDLALAHGLRACWSTPILSSAGRVLGTFATYYREPRSPSTQEHNVIERITHLASIAVEREQAEATRRESEAYLAEAQRLSHTGSWAWTSATGEMRYWSEECYRVLGFDPHGGLPRLETFFQRIHPDDQARTTETIECATREKADFVLDYRIVHPGGEIRDVHSVGHPVLGLSGDLVEFVGTVIDVTERKWAEEERERLRQAQADLAHVSRVTTMGELTASLAHEVNQPIGAAVTNANACLRWLTRDHPDVEEARAAAMRIVKDGTRAAEIISRIRLLFKKGTPEREVVDVNEVIREMIVLLHREATRYAISVRTELAADLPQVMADHVQLQQVMMNLIMNGIDAMKDMEGTRELAIKSQRVENEQLLVSVSDTGMGLPPQQADQIFNAFFTTKLHGTGMGLRISRSIVESHGGRLWAADNSPRGARFCFTLLSKAEAHE